MNPLHDPYIVSLLAGLLITAAVIDLRIQKIPNLLTFSAVLTGLAYHFALNGTDGLAFSTKGVAVGVGVAIWSKAIAVASFSGIGVGVPGSLDNGLLLQDVKLNARMNSHMIRLMTSPVTSGSIPDGLPTQNNHFRMLSTQRVLVDISIAQKRLIIEYLR